MAKQLRTPIEGESITRLDTKEYPDHMRVKCDCGGYADTKAAEMSIKDIDGSCIWMGVPCDKCGDKFTVRTYKKEATN